MERRPAAEQVPGWVREMYALVDAGQVDAYMGGFAEDVELRFASRAPVLGRDAVRDALGAGHAEHDMRHTIVGVWEGEDTTIVEFDVDYTYRDGRILSVPSLTLLRRRAGLIESMRIYVDQHP